MFTDTHCHLSYLSERGFDLSAVLAELALSHVPCVIDAGTKAGDLSERIALITDALSRISTNGTLSDMISASGRSPEDIKKEALALIRYTAGIWPDPDAIKDREAQIKTLRSVVERSLKGEDGLPSVCCIGECGHDHHWNIAGADHRDEADFASAAMFNAESELFEMQIELAREFNLPVMVHTRDAFEYSYDSIKNMGYNNGEIHCFSYSIEEARKFLDLGWYIALGGGVTYTKKSKQEAMDTLIRYIPDDMLLLETDAPYLAPVPERGKPNSPLLIKHTYAYIAERRGITPEKLAELVLTNTRHLYGN
ncbi:MAG: TatD family hydrolase [Treponema sp.]|nr:TatD family hydrolase [Candidatus Treponema caballi]